jgi:hypothetical protein
MLSPPVEPFMTDFTHSLMCPEFSGQALCCNDQQNTELVTEFELIDYLFGGKSGGCDACAANLKRMWCYFTCSPNQGDFVKSGPQEIVQNPMNSTPSYVLMMPANLTVTERYAEDLYSSCKKCAFTQQVPSIQSPHAFLQFQGTNSFEMGLLFITVYFVDSLPALDLSVVPCSHKASEVYGFPTKPCSCDE